VAGGEADVNVPGKGLAQGLGVTLKSMTKPSVTQEYPHQHP
jgi:formate hydrogenlyase subunit 6/NADH:ubiquinone oxidoreductase subunit I